MPPPIFEASNRAQNYLAFVVQKIQSLGNQAVLAHVFVTGIKRHLPHVNWKIQLQIFLVHPGEETPLGFEGKIGGERRKQVDMEILVECK